MTNLHRLWLGISDVSSTNEWAYQSNGNFLTWTNWNNGEPNNIWNGNDEDCAAAFYTDNFEWTDYRCAYKFPSICEFTMVPIPIA